MMWMIIGVALAALIAITGLFIWDRHRYRIVRFTQDRRFSRRHRRMAGR